MFFPFSSKALKEGCHVIATDLCGKDILTGKSNGYSPSYNYTDCDPPAPLDQANVVCCCPGIYQIDESGQIYREGEGAETTTNKGPKFTVPELQIKIPGLDLREKKVNCEADSSGNYRCEVPWLGEYIKAIYNYGFSIAGILAAILLMAGGVLWLVSGGDASKVTQAKELIIGSVTGLIILAASYVLLIQINPDLVKFRPISIGHINKLELGGDVNTPFNADQGITKLTKLAGLSCGQDSIKQIVDKTKGKVTYSQEKRGQVGPNNTLYLDCSSYASLVLKCAGVDGIPAYTGSIFQDKQEFNGDVASLQPGDLIGWPPGTKDGHVLIYLGNNQFGDCHGGSGKTAGNAIGNSHSLTIIQETAKSYSAGKLYIRKK